MRSFLFAVLLMLIAAPAFAVAIGPDPPNPDAAAIAALVNQYLVASEGAITQGGWLDATPAGDVVNRGQHLLLPTVPALGAGTGTIRINGFNSGEQAIIHYDDGAGNSGSVSALLTQLAVSYTGDGAASVDFDTFCIDLLHTLTVGQTYAVDSRSDLASAFANGARLAYVYQAFGVTNLTGDPIQAAAVQIALWDLSLSNHNPTSFTQDASGTYSSGDPEVFRVDFTVKVPEPPTGAMLLVGVVLPGLMARSRTPSRAIAP